MGLHKIMRAVAGYLLCSKGKESRVQFGKNGYYFIEAFKSSLEDREKACAGRWYRESKIPTSKVQLRSVEDIQSQFRDFVNYLFCSSSPAKADKLRGIGWEPIDLDWLHMF